jgi:hypothetical protein
MELNAIVAEIEAEIRRLREVRALLAGERILTGRPGRPAMKRVLSPEARERIAAAQRKRWAAQKKIAKKTA